MKGDWKNNTDCEAEKHVKIKAPFDLNEVEVEDISFEDQKNNVQLKQQLQSWDDFLEEHI